ISVNSVDMTNDNAVLIVEQIDETAQLHAHYFTNEDKAYEYICSKPSLIDAKLKLEFTRDVRELAELTGDINKTNPEDFSDAMKEKLASFNTIQEKGVGVLYDFLNAQGPTTI